MSATCSSAIAEARGRGFVDPPDLAAALATDDLERAACLEALMRWNTPEAAAAYMTAHGGREARNYWTGMHPADRQLYRRRASTLVLGYVGAAA